MDRRWATLNGTNSDEQSLINYAQVHTSGFGSPYINGRNAAEQLVSIRPDLLVQQAPEAMPTKGRGNKVVKPDIALRRGSRQSSLPFTAQEQLEQFAQQASDPNITQESPSVDLGHQLDSSAQFVAAGVLTNSTGLSSIQQALVAGREGFQLDQHYLSDSQNTPSPGPTDNTNGTEMMESSVPSRTAADVAMGVYGDTLRIDSALCKKLAGEAARREPTQRRSDQKLNIERRSNVEALLAHVTGEVAGRPCKNCHKGHGPWTQCVVYDGQMCGSCTNCWFNASGSRCTFHENNNPQSLHFPSSASAPAGSPGPQPANTRQQSSAPVAASVAAAPPTVPLQQPDISQWALADQTRHFLSQAMGDIVGMTKRERHIARIEAAAKELGIRIAEYDEYLRTPEGMAEQQRLEEQQQLNQHGQMGDISKEEDSPVGRLA